MEGQAVCSPQKTKVFNKTLFTALESNIKKILKWGVKSSLTSTK